MTPQEALTELEGVIERLGLNEEAALYVLVQDYKRRVAGESPLEAVADTAVKQHGR